MLPRTKILATCIFFWFLLSVNLYAQTENLEENREQHLDQNVIVQFYREHISNIDGDRCQMHPSCSQYTANVFSKHGFFIGWMMVSDRLMRCGRDEIDISPKIQKQGRIYTLDPVSANDSWWFEGQIKE